MNPPSPRRLWIQASLVALTAILLDVALAKQRGLWIDEFFTLYATRMNIPAMIHDRLLNGHSPLYFFYARLGLLLGESERALRFTSALAIGAAVLTTTGLALELGLARLLPILWLLELLQPYWITIGTQFRYMAVMLALGGALLWLAARYLAVPTRRRAALLGLAFTLMIWIHSSAHFLLPGLALAIFLQARAAGASRRRAAARCWPLLLAELLGIPILLLTEASDSDLPSAVPRAHKLLAMIMETVFGKDNWWPDVWGVSGTPFLIVGLLLFLAAVALAHRFWRAEGHALALLLCGCLLLTMPAAMFLLCISFRNYEATRYLTCFSIPALLCLAAAWHAPAPLWIRRSFRAVLCVVVLVQAAAAAIEHGDLYRESAQWVIRQHVPGDPIIVSSLRPNRLGLTYYGLDSPRDLVGFSASAPQAVLTQTIAASLRGHTHAFFMHYHAEVRLAPVLERMRGAGGIAGFRFWTMNDGVLIGAIAVRPEDRAWLEGLRRPRRPAGPQDSYLPPAQPPKTLR